MAEEYARDTMHNTTHQNYLYNMDCRTAKKSVRREIVTGRMSTPIESSMGSGTTFSSSTQWPLYTASRIAEGLWATKQ